MGKTYEPGTTSSYKEYPDLAESFLMRPDLILPVADNQREELREASSNG